MPRYTSAAKSLGIALAALCWVAACARSVPIRELIDHPRDYAGKTVTIEGDVTAVYSLFVIKYFEVNDGSGVIGVVTERPLPQQGEHIRVTGTLQEAFSLGDKTMTILLERDPNASKTPSPTR